jgi:hypothetical protein
VYQSHTGRLDWALVPAKPAQRLNTNKWMKYNYPTNSSSSSRSRQHHGATVPGIQKIFLSFLLLHCCDIGDWPLQQFAVRYLAAMWCCFTLPVVGFPQIFCYWMFRSVILSAFHKCLFGQYYRAVSSLKRSIQNVPCQAGPLSWYRSASRTVFMCNTRYSIIYEYMHTHTHTHIYIYI